MEKDINWEQRRYEIAKGLVSSCGEPMHPKDMPGVAYFSIMMADILIEELKKPKKQDNPSRIVELAPEMYKALEEIACYNLCNRNNNKFYFDDVIEMKSIAKKALEKCKTDYPEIEE